MLTLRFDMRAPATGAPPVDLYSAALEPGVAWPYLERAAHAAEIGGR